MTLTADSTGRLRGKFRVPPNVSTGTKLAEFFGAGGSYGQFQFRSEGEIWQERKQRVTVNTTTVTSTTVTTVQGVSYVTLPPPPPAVDPVVDSGSAAPEPAPPVDEVPDYVWEEPPAEPDTAPKPVIEPQPQSPVYSATITIDNITADNVLNYAEAMVNGNRTITGSVSGDAAVGDTITVSVAGRSWTTTLAKDGKWSVGVSNTALVNSYSRAMLTATVTSPARGSIPAGSATATKVYRIDTAASVNITLDPVRVSAVAGARDTVTITGSAWGDAKPGDRVILDVGPIRHIGWFDDYGDRRFSFVVNARTLAAQKFISATITVKDEAGNSAKATATADVTNVPAQPAAAPAIVVTQKACSGQDPLAQTFTLERAAQIGAVELYVTVPGTRPVTVSLRRTQAGVPILVELARSTRPAGGLAARSWQRWTFHEPISLAAGEEYAIVVMTDDADASIGIAELGKWDAARGRWVTSQPYTIGVLLSSSNASTWTPHQDADMAFRLLSASYAATTRTINLGAVYVNDVTDLMLLASERIPNGDCRVNYSLELPGGATLPIAPRSAVRLRDSITGIVTLRAELIGTASASPIVEPGAQLLVGQYVDDPQVYISRGVAAGVGSRVVVIYDAAVPDGAAVTPHLADSADALDWQAFPAPRVTPLSDAWAEYRYEIPAYAADLAFVRLTLSGSSGARPMVANLRVIVI